MIVKLLGHW